MKHSITSDQNLKTMTIEAFNRSCDTLEHEVNNHPHKDELLNLMWDQITDLSSTCYL